MKLQANGRIECIIHVFNRSIVYSRNSMANSITDRMYHSRVQSEYLFAI
jgi:hypothetical protein